MQFSVAQVWVDSGVALAGTAGVVLAYLAGAALAGRRFGPRGVWAACAAMVALGCVPALGAAGRGDGWAADAGAVVVAVTLPTLASAWMLARMARRPRPAALPLQVAAGGAVFVLAIPVTVVLLVAAAVALA